MDIGAIAEELGAFVPDFDHRRETFIAILRAHFPEPTENAREAADRINAIYCETLESHVWPRSRITAEIERFAQARAEAVKAEIEEWKESNRSVCADNVELRAELAALKASRGKGVKIMITMRFICEKAVRSADGRAETVELRGATKYEAPLFSATPNGHLEFVITNEDAFGFFQEKLEYSIHIDRTGGEIR